MAGDWNLLRGYGENGDLYWKARYDTVFNRAEALGLQFVGPEHPNGCQANPWPDGFPATAFTYQPFTTQDRSRQPQPGSSTSYSPRASIADHIKVRALNTPDEWGPSDHCQVLIEAHR